MSAYGMDTSGDGVLDAEELAAYREYLAQKEAEARAHAQMVEDSKAAAKAQMETQYDTVPGFAARRGWHGMETNTHNYAEPLKKEDAVFAYNKLKPGPMAQMMAKAVDPSAGMPMEPRGRARTQGGGGIDGAVPFYE